MSQPPSGKLPQASRMGRLLQGEADSVLSKLKVPQLPGAFPSEGSEGTINHRHFFLSQEKMCFCITDTA